MKKLTVTGFTLLELQIGIVLFGVLSMGYYRDQRIENDIGLASVQAQRFQQISTALGNFMSDNYSSIKALSFAENPNYFGMRRGERLFLMRETLG